MLRAWLGVLSALLGSVSTVHAADLESAWRAPTTCPSAQRADELLRERTGGVSSLSTGAAEVWIDHAPSGELRARITLMHAEGREQRVLYGGDCEALSDAVLLVISMASEEDEGEDSDLALASVSESRVRDRSAAHITHGSLAEPIEAQASPIVTSTRLGVGLALDRGALPDTAPAGGGVLSLGARRFQGSLSVSYFSRKLVRVAEGTDASAEFGLISGELRACYLALGDAFESTKLKARKGYALGPCVGLELGALRGQGAGLTRAATHTGLWAASLFGLNLALGPYGRVVPTGSLSLGFAMRRPRFEVDEAGLVFQSKPVFMRATLGFSVELNP